MTTDQHQPATKTPRSFFWRLVVYAHLVAAALWWWLMPAGFPIGHARFWTNQVFPLIAVALCLACLWAERQGNLQLRTLTAATIPAFWLSAIIVAVDLFPYSARRFGLPAFACLAIVSAAFWISFRRQQFRRWPTSLAVGLSMTAAGGFICAQRACDPDTSPLNAAFPKFEGNVDSRMAAIPVHLSDNVDVLTADGRVALRHITPPQRSDEMPTPLPSAGGLRERAYRLEIEPLLTFERRSPDRFWTIFAPTRYSGIPLRTLTTLWHDDTRLVARYGDDTTLKLHTDSSDDVTTIEAFARLDHPIFSHLNSVASFTISGCRKPTISFSPCAALQVDVTLADYPVGRPMRLAYVDDIDIFHVVEAHSGEKGPFREFGSGPLPRAAPLTITILDDTTAVFRVTLDDWAAQAARSLSPTAGWGLPVNAIEFSQIGDPGSAGGAFAIWMTLSGTSVGRGWDSVGHAAGTYRNRMRIEIHRGENPSR